MLYLVKLMKEYNLTVEKVSYNAGLGASQLSKKLNLVRDFTYLELYSVFSYFVRIGLLEKTDDVGSLLDVV